jgi:hypothetical protein
MDQGNMFNDIYDIMRKNLILLIIIVVVAALAGAFFSGESFMKPRYKSIAAVYPINTIPHSDESETEQMLQVFASEQIKEAVLDTFKLWNRWDDLKPGEPEYRHWSNELYKERVSISPTRYESVEIVCQDEDPAQAQQMAQLIIKEYNLVARKKDRDIHLAYLAMKESELKNLGVVLDSVESRMQKLRMAGSLLDFESQSERVTEGYMRMLQSGTGIAKIDKVKKMIADLARDGSELQVLQEMTESLNVYYSELNKERVQAMSKAFSNLNYAAVVVEPQEADKKSYPVRWFIVLMSVVLSTLAAIVFIVATERYSRAK